MPDVWWNRGVVLVIWATPVLLVTIQIVRNLLLYPNGVPATLFAQTEALAQTGELRNLAVDRDTKQFFQTVRHTIERNAEFRPGDPVISIYDLPGLVYVLGGISPGEPWIYSGAQEQRRNCAALQSSGVKNLDRSIVLMSAPMRPSFRACLRAVGIVFPAHYRLVGVARYPYDGSMVKVYVPTAQEVRTERGIADVTQ